MDKETIIKLIQEDLDHASFCSDRDWEFNTGGNGVNASEAYFALRGLAQSINEKAGEQLLKFEYDEEKMKEIYRGFGYPVDEDDEDGEDY